MPLEDSPAGLVARFLRANNYLQTLDAFLKEANLPDNAGTSAIGSLTIEQILDEKRVFDTSLSFEKLNSDDRTIRWSSEAPGVAHPIQLSAAANVLQTSIETIQLFPEAFTAPFIVATTSDRLLSIVPVRDAAVQSQYLRDVQDSPILSYIVLWQRYIMSTSMSGSLAIFDLCTGAKLCSRKDHSKYAVKVASHLMDRSRYLVATAGWDGKVFLYVVQTGTAGNPKLTDPVGMIKPLTNPEDIIFVMDSSTGRLFLLLSRRESTVLQYYDVSELPKQAATAQNQQPVHLDPSGSQNLAPYANSWVSFTPTKLSLSPIDPSLLAVATSAVPHMKLIVVRLLFPDPGLVSSLCLSRSDENVNQEASYGTNAAEAGASNITERAREATLRQDREAAAIQLHCNTMAPQSTYSTPVVTWRPDGSGIWANSDDGIIRGIEASSGKVVVTLRSHDPGSKIRCIWAGNDTYRQGSRELLLSGGFDQKLLMWSPENDKAGYTDSVSLSLPESQTGAG